MKVEQTHIRVAFALDALVPNPPRLTVFTGTITIVREGCVPAAKVQQTFDRVKSSVV